MNLINSAMSTRIPDQAFFLLLQWFQSTLRNGTGDVVHFMKKVSGCGEIVHTIARKEFFSILKTATQKLKEEKDEKNISHILDVFYWSYSSADLQELAKIDIFKVLQEGDGNRLNVLRTSWGHILRQKKDEQDYTLTRKVIKLFNFLFKSILRSIVNEDINFNIMELARSNSTVNTA